MRNLKKNVIINSKTCIFLIVIILFLQIILISHRNSFSFNLFGKFYQKNNIGLIEGIKNQNIFDIIQIIENNNLSNYKLSENLLSSETIRQRTIEGSYPSLYSNDSKYLISDNFVKNNLCNIINNINNIKLYICE